MAVRLGRRGGRACSAAPQRGRRRRAARLRACISSSLASRAFPLPSCPIFLPHLSVCTLSCWHFMVWTWAFRALNAFKRLCACIPIVWTTAGFRQALVRSVLGKTPIRHHYCGAWAWRSYYNNGCLASIPHRTVAVKVEDCVAGVCEQYPGWDACSRRGQSHLFISLHAQAYARNISLACAPSAFCILAAVLSSSLRSAWRILLHAVHCCRCCCGTRWRLAVRFEL